MFQLIINMILWIFISIILATVSSLILTSLLLDKNVKVSFNISNQWKLTNFLFSGALKDGVLGAVISLGNDEILYNFLNVLQDRKYWSKYTFKDLEYITKNHINWNVRTAALKALVKAATNGEREDLRYLLSINSDEEEEVNPHARQEILEMIAYRI